MRNECLFFPEMNNKTRKAEIKSFLFSSSFISKEKGSKKFQQEENFNDGKMNSQKMLLKLKKSIMLINVSFCYQFRHLLHENVQKI